jgi:hypothetical protein|tara:strand:+ start:890 stop:1207 length:318 start_codon:yes stop_codon:yes gene_type:complete
MEEKENTMSAPKLGDSSWMQLKEFDQDVFIEWFTEEAINGRMTEERMQAADWGVSAQFLINAGFDADAADRAKWMQPIMFLTGISVGMIGGALLSLEAPIYWLAF